MNNFRLFLLILCLWGWAVPANAEPEVAPSKEVYRSEIRQKLLVEISENRDEIKQDGRSLTKTPHNSFELDYSGGSSG